MPVQSGHIGGECVLLQLCVGLVNRMFFNLTIGGIICHLSLFLVIDENISMFHWSPFVQPLICYFGVLLFAIYIIFV